MSPNIQHTDLNEVQIGLLRMFDRNIPENDIREIKQVLVKHLSKQLLDEVDRVVEEKGITDADFKRLETEQISLVGSLTIVTPLSSVAGKLQSAD